jgi:hypothetical protein
MSPDELRKIAKIWGCEISIQITSGGIALTDLAWDDLMRVARTYPSLDTAVEGLLLRLKERAKWMVDVVELSNSQ